MRFCHRERFSLPFGDQGVRIPNMVGFERRESSAGPKLQRFWFKICGYIPHFDSASPKLGRTSGTTHMRKGGHDSDVKIPVSGHQAARDVLGSRWTVEPRCSHRRCLRSRTRSCCRSARAAAPPSWSRARCRRRGYARLRSGGATAPIACLPPGGPPVDGSRQPATRLSR
jgi:hypothetical protein